MADMQIPRSALLWILVASLAAMLPHSQHLPIGMWGLAALVTGWRWLTHLGRVSYPGRWVKAVAVVLASAGVVVAFGRSLSLESAAAFLLAANMLKLLEMRYRRDVYVSLFLSFFVLGVGLLFDQGILSALYAIIVVWLLVCALVAVHRNPQRVARTGDNGRLAKASGMILLSSLPMMLVLYLLFPRLAPLWSFNLQSEKARTGLSETMAPGDIADLSQSDEVAFRVSFGNDQLPDRAELYWRGLVLDQYDGRRWAPTKGQIWGKRDTDWYPGKRVLPDDPAVIAYDIIQEPTGERWLFAIRGIGLEQERTGLTADERLVSRQPVHNRIRYRVKSLPSLALSPDVLSLTERQQSLALPDDSNPRSRAFAARLRGQSADDGSFLLALMANFRTQPFYYTLRPPALGDNDIDAFMFDSRRGFCAHYAGAFVFMARAAGIPARIVAGYQGGDWNAAEKYLTVHQYDAHAWAEAWLPHQGWVRFDPTAMVAPERISLGLEAAVKEEGSFLEKQTFSMQKFKGFGLLNALRLQFDNLNYYWMSWVLAYDKEQQKNFLQNVLQLGDYENGLYLLGASFGLFFVLASVLLWWNNRPLPQTPFMKAWRQLQARGEKAGIQPQTGETSSAYLNRLMQAFPQKSADIQELSRAINAALYEQGAVSKALLRKIKALRLSR